MRRQVSKRAMRAVMAVAVVGALSSGCGAGPSQVGSAVIVGSRSVPTSEVQTRLDQMFARKDLVDELAAHGVGAPEITRDVVTQTVLHELSVRVAAAEGIVVSPADIDAELQLNGGVETLLERWLFDLPLLRERIGDQLIAERLAAKQVNGLAVIVDILGVASREQAVAAARLLAAGGPSADELFTQNPQTSLQGFEYRAGANPDIATSAVFGTPVGSTGYFQPTPGQDNWIVFRVLDRRVLAPTAAAEPDAVATIGKAGLADIGIRLLQPVAAQSGVRVNPRYGVWDPIAMRVLAEDRVTGAILPPSAG